MEMGREGKGARGVRVVVCVLVGGDWDLLGYAGRGGAMGISCVVCGCSQSICVCYVGGRGGGGVCGMRQGSDEVVYVPSWGA